jgi:hypothetical protein
VHLVAVGFFGWPAPGRHPPFVLAAAHMAVAYILCWRPAPPALAGLCSVSCSGSACSGQGSGALRMQLVLACVGWPLCRPRECVSVLLLGASYLTKGYVGDLLQRQPLVALLSMGIA